MERYIAKYVGQFLDISPKKSILVLPHLSYKLITNMILYGIHLNHHNW